MTIRLIFLLMAFALIAPHAAHGQFDGFLREFSISEYASANGVAVDDTGIYVAGDADSVGNVRKHDLSGNELWSHTFRRLGSADGIVVYSGSVYVVGSQIGGAFLRKYESDGREQWTRQLGAIWRTALAADATGVYVVGKNATSGIDGYLRKYAGTGQEMWRRESSITLPTDVVVDATGVYVLGLAPSGGYLRKYTVGGQELWTRDLSNNGDPAGAAVDATGLYIVGNRNQFPMLGKYDSNGNELWIRELVDPSSQFQVWLSGVAVDSTGVYIVGRTEIALPGLCRSGLRDAFVRKYDADGVPLWTRQFSGSLDSGWGHGVAVNATGVYVAGSTMGCLHRLGPGEGAPLDYRDCDSNVLLAKLEKTQPVSGESGPWITPGCVVNAASYLGGRVSPGEIVTIFGRRIGPLEATSAPLTEENRFATTLAGTRILFNNIAAPLIWVSAQQINAIVPYAVAKGPTVEVEVEYQGVRSNVVTMPVAASRPGLFTLDGSGRGPVTALNEDGSINSTSNPAERGSAITLFATGEGLTEPVVEDGLVLDTVLPKPKLPPAVFFCCYADQIWVGDVLYAGGARDSVAGLLQVKVRIPRDMYLNQYVGSNGSVSMEIRIGGQSSGLDNYVFIRDVPKER